MSERNWSEQQSAIFSWFKSGSGNLVVRARAGTGKTTTIVEGSQRATESRILLAAFNKAIATELQSRIKGDKVKAKTLHGLGCAYVMRLWGKVEIDGDGERARMLTDEALKEANTDAPFEVKRMINQIHTKMREICPRYLDHENALGIMARFDLMPDDQLEEDGWESYRIAELACAAAEAAKIRTATIDFADMIFLPIVHKAIIPWYDMVIVDEAQDMTMPQLEIATGACKRSGRIVIVGDDRQAIYGFRGADSGSLDRLKDKLHAVELGLTTTYRCPKRIVAIAARIVPDFKAAPTAPDGLVDRCDDDKMRAQAQPGDFILSRLNAPLVPICMSLLKMGKRATIKGRDIGKGITALINKLHASDLADLAVKLDEWYKREVQRAKGLSEDAAANRIGCVSDQRAVCTALMESCKDIPELRTKLDELFADNTGDAIVCSTTHRAKGLEADTVWLLEGTYRGQTEGEEANLKYVAITRAKKRLVWVSGFGNGKAAPPAEKTLS